MIKIIEEKVNNFYDYDNYYQKAVESGNKLRKFKYIFSEDTPNFLLKNKTEKLKEYIKLYETYVRTHYEFPSIFNIYDTYINNLNEGLIMSYSYDDFVKHFIKNTGIQDVDISFINNNGALTKSLKILLYRETYLKYKNIIEHYINKCGYFISNITNADEEEGGFIYELTYIFVEPKYIVELTSEELENDLIYDKNNQDIKNKCNGILYHITPAYYYNKIENKGLIPKAGNKKSNHPERIYFYPANFLPNGNLKAAFIYQAKSLYLKKDEKLNKICFADYAKKFVKNNELEIVVLKIDLYKYNRLKYRFFQDPNLPAGVFTYEPVSPACVELYTTFKIREE